MIQLVRPGPEHLSGCVAALERGLSYDDERSVDAAREELARIQTDAAAFLASMEDREAKGPPITLPDGSAAKRLPGFRRWLWDGEFCGSAMELYASIPPGLCQMPDTGRSSENWPSISSKSRSHFCAASGRHNDIPRET